MSSEDPPEEERQLTPAERAGATHLDPDLFRMTAAQSAARAAAAGPQPQAQGSSEVAAVRRPARRRHSSRSSERSRARSSQPWLITAGCAAVLSFLLAATGYSLQEDTPVADGPTAPLVLATNLLSARRVAEVVVRPVAARNLDASLKPILANAPADTCVQVRDSNNAVFSSNESKPLLPASNMKLLVAAAALKLLDPNSRLTTRFATDGKPTDGSTVQGNLYMIGAGDPVLSTASFAARPDRVGQAYTDLDKAADQIYDSGIRTITGSVVGDASRYDDLRSASSWPDRYITQGQVAPLSALLVNDGTDASGAVVKDPTVHAAAVLTELLRSRGVKIQSDPKSAMVPKSAHELTQIESPTVGELVTEALRFSDNTTTEMLVKELGLSAGGAGSTAAGVEVLQKWLASSGLPAEGVSFDDGSGLSPNDRVTCALFSSLLAADGSSGSIANSLAVPGEHGTLDDRFLAEPLRSSLRAKTGTLLQVTSLSGWLTTTSKRDLDFSVLINTGNRNVTASDLTTQREVLQALLKYPEAPALESLVPLPAVPPQGS
ncbi:MAG: D-alanyl-D-alanine carboxypeptidase/D-alanyl-D-alanine-endopeptidase [Actinomycetes bacterium]